jgi:uncharacterized protein
MNEITQLPIEITKEIEIRRGLFVASIPSALKAKEDSIATVLAFKNASTRSKLGSLYRLTDEIAEHAKPYVACGRGCSNCCKMNIQISDSEASKIADETGHRPTQLKQSIDHSSEKFAGKTCPFLVDDACSIYQSRPLVCRSHFSFDTTAYWCHPDRMGTVAVPLIRFDGIQSAFLSITKHNNGSVFADIRDFFTQ